MRTMQDRRDAGEPFGLTDENGKYFNPMLRLLERKTFWQKIKEFFSKE